METLYADANRDLATLLEKLEAGEVADWQVQALLSRVHYKWARAADLWLQHLTGKDFGRSTRGGPPRTKWRLLATPARFDSDGYGGLADHSLRQVASRIDLVKFFFRQGAVDEGSEVWKNWRAIWRAAGR